MYREVSQGVEGEVAAHEGEEAVLGLGVYLEARGEHGQGQGDLVQDERGEGDDVAAGGVGWGGWGQQDGREGGRER